MSWSMRSGRGRARSRVSVIVGVVVFAALVVASLRFVPDAAVDPGSEELGDVIFEISADNILGIAKKTFGVRSEDNHSHGIWGVRQ